MRNESGTCLEDVTIIQICASIGHSSFGLGYAAVNLAASLRRAGADVYMGCVDTEDDVQEACEESGLPRERVIRGDLLGPPKLRFSPSLSRQLRNLPVRNKVVVHAHGLWTYASRAAMTAREYYRSPLVVSPHGSLERWALKLSPRKKEVASLLFENKNLSTASCFWALSDQEKQSIRAYGLSGRVEVIGNGVNSVARRSAQEISVFRQEHAIADGDRVLLFLSRITPKKGLPLLLRSFAKNLRTAPGWTLVIAGSDEGNHIEEVRQLIDSLGLGPSVRLIGPVFGDRKAVAFSAASLFVLPSYSEGFPIAVLEAMEYSLPVVLTDTWALPCSVDKPFGWQVAAEQFAIQKALLEAMTAPTSLLDELGGNAQSVVRQNFTWDIVAGKACTLYESLL